MSMKVEGPSGGITPPGGEEKGIGAKISEAFSGLLGKISSLNPLAKAGGAKPEEIEMTNFAAAPKGKEEVTDKITMAKETISAPTQDASQKGEAMKEVADKAPQTAKESTPHATTTKETVRTISKEKAEQTRKQLLEGGPVGGGKIKSGPVKPGISKDDFGVNTSSGQVKEKPTITSHEAPDAIIRTKIEGKHGGKAKETELSETRDKLLKEGADLKTKQGEVAEGKQAKINGCLTGGVARRQVSAFDQITPKDVKGPKDQFLGVITTLDQLVDQVDLSKKENCDFLNGLAGLMHKGFNVDTGGIGSMHDKKGWNSAWNDLGGKRALATDNPNNEDIKKEFKAMLKYYSEHAEAHFSSSRHVGGLELAACQTDSTIGQLVQDFAFNVRAFPEATRTQLTTLMEQNGILHPSMVSKGPEGQAALPAKVGELKDAMRGNPLLAEVPNSEIKANIVDGLNVEKTKQQMLSLIKDELRKSDPNKDDPQKKMSDAALTELATQVYDNYTKRIGDMRTKATNTGARGRLPFDAKEATAPKEMGKVLAGAEGVKYSIAAQPNRSNDQVSVDWVKDTLGQAETPMGTFEDAEIHNFFTAIEGEQNILKHSVSPKVPLRLGEGLDSNFVKLMDPGTVFQDAVKDVLANEKDVSKQAALKGLSQSADDKDSSFAAGYKSAVGSIEVTFNGATKQKMPLGKFASMESVASMMFDKDIRTICSISGTTVDIILSRCNTSGKEHMKEVLQPLLDHLEGKQPDPLGTPGTPEGQRFKELASAIGFFMQAGKYHTAGEVVGGLFIAARALSTSKEENTNIDHTFELFGKLMDEFSKAPETFLSVSQGDLAKIKENEGEFTKRVHQAEVERVSARAQESAKLGV